MKVDRNEAQNALDRASGNADKAISTYKELKAAAEQVCLYFVCQTEVVLADK